ncbi:uncharacterized protein LOC144596249 [Rhinoraja longicauda]
MMMEQGLTNQFDSAFMSINTPTKLFRTSVTIQDNTLGTNENTPKIEFHDETQSEPSHGFFDLDAYDPPLEQIKIKYEPEIELNKTRDTTDLLEFKMNLQTNNESVSKNNEISDERLLQAMYDAEFDVSPTSKSKQGVPSRRGTEKDTDINGYQMAISSSRSVVKPSTSESPTHSSSKEDLVIATMTGHLIETTQNRFTGSTNFTDISSFAPVLENNQSKNAPLGASIDASLESVNPEADSSGASGASTPRSGYKKSEGLRHSVYLSADATSLQSLQRQYSTQTLDGNQETVGEYQQYLPENFLSNEASRTTLAELESDTDVDESNEIPRDLHKFEQFGISELNTRLLRISMPGMWDDDEQFKHSLPLPMKRPGVDNTFRKSPGSSDISIGSESESEDITYSLGFPGFQFSESRGILTKISESSLGGNEVEEPISTTKSLKSQVLTNSRRGVGKRKLQKEQHITPVRKEEKEMITPVSIPFVVDRFDMEETMEGEEEDEREDKPFIYDSVISEKRDSIHAGSSKLSIPFLTEQRLSKSHSTDWPGSASSMATFISSESEGNGLSIHQNSGWDIFDESDNEVAFEETESDSEQTGTTANTRKYSGRRWGLDMSKSDISDTNLQQQNGAVVSKRSSASLKYTSRHRDLDLPLLRAIMDSDPTPDSFINPALSKHLSGSQKYIHKRRSLDLPMPPMDLIIKMGNLGNTSHDKGSASSQEHTGGHRDLDLTMSSDPTATSLPIQQQPRQISNPALGVKTTAGRSRTVEFIGVKSAKELSLDQGGSASQRETTKISRPVSEQQDNGELSESTSEEGDGQTSNQALSFGHNEMDNDATLVEIPSTDEEQDITNGGSKPKYSSSSQKRKVAGYHTMDFGGNEPSLSSFLDQNMSAPQRETTTISRPVSEHQIIGELPETEATSEDVNGHLRKVAGYHTMDFGGNEPSLSSFLDQNMSAPQRETTTISRPVSEHQIIGELPETEATSEDVNGHLAQSSQNNQKDEDATFVEIPATDEEQDILNRGSKPKHSSSSQNTKLARRHTVDFGRNNISLSSVLDQNMSASQRETTTISRPVSEHQIISELPETEDTSEDVNGHLAQSSQNNQKDEDATFVEIPATEAEQDILNRGSKPKHSSSSQKTKLARRHTVDFGRNNISLSSVLDQNMSASQRETTTISRPVSEHQIISELPETEDTSEDVNGHLAQSSQNNQKDEDATFVEIPATEAEQDILNRGCKPKHSSSNQKVKLARCHTVDCGRNNISLSSVLDQNMSASQRETITISRPVSEHQIISELPETEDTSEDVNGHLAQSSQNNQKDEDATFVETPATDEEQDILNRGSKPKHSSSNQKTKLARRHTV